MSNMQSGSQNLSAEGFNSAYWTTLQSAILIKVHLLVCGYQCYTHFLPSVSW